MSEAIKEVKTSKKFRKWLEYVLAMGNYINGQGKRGGVWGFKLDTLEKIDRHRGNDGKTSILTYLVKYVEKQDPDLLNLLSEFSNVEKAKGILFSELLNQSKQLKSGLKVAESLLKDPPVNSKDKFQKLFGPFVDAANKQLEQQEQEIADVTKKLEKVISGYGEDATKMVRFIISNYILSTFNMLCYYFVDKHRVFFYFDCFRKIDKRK